MSLNTAQRLDRLKTRLAELPMWRERAAVPIADWRFEDQPIALGDGWPHRNAPVKFTASAQVPADWPLEETILRMDVGGESLLSLNYADGSVKRFGLDPYHREFPVTGRAFAIETQSVPRLPFGEPVRKPVLTEGRLIRLETELEDLHLLLTQVAETVEVLGEHEVVPHLLTAAEATLRSLVWPSATADYVARTAPLEQQQRIWELPELKADPARALQSHLHQ